MSKPYTICRRKLKGDGWTNCLWHKIKSKEVAFKVGKSLAAMGSGYPHGLRIKENGKFIYEFTYKDLNSLKVPMEVVGREIDE